MTLEQKALKRAQMDAFHAWVGASLDEMDAKWSQDVAAFRDEWPHIFTISYDRVADLSAVANLSDEELARVAGCPFAGINSDVVEIAAWLNEHDPNGKWDVLAHPHPFDGLIGFQDLVSAMAFKLRWL